ncbi:hypothetical protein ACODYM_29010 [Burkholderia gladioli]|uniref:DUF5983 family protein n=1 Tax=Burkholderia gladioli TaxID=28095 RepID=UPI003B5041AA
MFTITVPVLSTSHISIDTRNELSSMSQLNADVTGVSVCAEYAEGYFVFFDQANDPGRMSDNVRDVRAWAQKNGFEWIRLDSAGDEVAELPKYEW